MDTTVTAPPLLDREALVAARKCPLAGRAPRGMRIPWRLELLHTTLHRHESRGCSLTSG
jgi:hypothetical protein